MIPDQTLPECVPADRETDGWHCLMRMKEYEWAAWIDGAWAFAWVSGRSSARTAARLGYRYIAPAHPPQPVAPEVIESVENVIKYADDLWGSERDDLRRALAILRGEPDRGGHA